MHASYEVRTYFNYIGGKWVESKGGTIEGRNPATGEVVTKSAKSTPDEVSFAIEEARKAFDSGVWSSKRPAERAKVIRDIAELIRREADNLTV
ncbi:MAG: aldehyde dehydrogenase family protein, partial [Nitrososphaerota archaeon]|nr:aldehyde dehydrogenase family protein [Nitrososphaerota archaeon]